LVTPDDAGSAWESRLTFRKVRPRTRRGILPVRLISGTLERRTFTRRHAAAASAADGRLEMLERDEFIRNAAALG